MRGALAPLLALSAQAVRPASGNADFDQGLSLLEAGRPAEAIPLLRRGFAALPALPAAPFYLGRALLLAGDPREAREALERAARLAPLVPAVQTSLGEGAAAAGAFEQAERAFERAFELRPSDPAPLLLLGEMHLRRSVFAKAGEAFSRAAKVGEPGDVRAWRGLGEADLGRMDLPGAGAAFRRALAVGPRDGLSLYGLGMVLLRAGDLGGARAALLEAEGILRRDAGVAYELGTLAARAKDPREAIRWFRETLLRDPAHAGATHALGQTLLALGRTEEGRRTLERFRAKKPIFDAVFTASLQAAAAPADPGLRESLVLYSFALGDLERARRELEALGRLRPDWRGDGRLAAVGLCLEGRFEEALPRLRSALGAGDPTARAILEEVEARAAARKDSAR
ncbi:MAG TPA: tetratricopeptide repeat protein [Planctomycetota bacterium]|jgi:tetratricopeptide (TPR) repeat protein|nr:tetratricopeptide repeat protein [Planctomycetota bacterium]